MTKRKALVVLYEGISLFEMTQLTSYLTSYQPMDESWVIDTAGSSKSVVTSEDNIPLCPQFDFSEIVLKDYELLILSGIIDFQKVIHDQKLIDFLASLKEMTVTCRPLIASICASPILLAKAGVLDGVKFTSSLFEEHIIASDFINSANIIRQPVVYDEKNRILTAMGFAQRNFAIKAANLLGYQLNEDAFIGVQVGETFNEEELIFYLNE